MKRVEENPILVGFFPELSLLDVILTRTLLCLKLLENLDVYHDTENLSKALEFYFDQMGSLQASFNGNLC